MTDEQHSVSPVTKAVIPAAGLAPDSCPPPRRRPRRCCRSSTSRRSSTSSRRRSPPGSTTSSWSPGATSGHRGPLRPGVRAGGGARRPRATSERLAAVRESSRAGRLHYVRQGEPKGLGHAVLCAQQHVGDEPFAVLLGDDLIDARDPLLQRMIEVREQHGGSVVALMEVTPSRSRCTACAAIEPTDEDDVVGSPTWSRSRRRTRRPPTGRSSAATCCDPAVFDVLREDPAGPRRRDPAHRRAADARPAQLRRGRPGARRAVPRPPLRHRQQARLPAHGGAVRRCERPDLAPEFVPWLREFLEDDSDRRPMHRSPSTTHVADILADDRAAIRRWPRSS